MDTIVGHMMGADPVIVEMALATLRRYQGAAETHAAARAAEMVEAGELDLAQFWRDVRREILRIQSAAPAGGPH